MNELIEFPEALKPYQSLFEQTRKKFIKIKNYRKGEVEIWQSKFGGRPFLPIEIEYPKDKNGNYMYLLAQINFAEVPPLDYLPTQGVLQFYIADDDLFGLDFDDMTNQSGFKVLYFPQIDKNNYQTNLPILKEPVDFPFLDALKPFALEFEVSEEYAGLNDVNLKQAFGSKWTDFEQLIEANNYKYLDWVYDNIQNNGHKLGGYAYFTQQDPRDWNEKYLEGYESLLFQIDSDDEIMWGDVGVANFFISQEKLKKLDFSDILYSWDCS